MLIVLLLGSLFLEQLDVQIKHEGRSLPKANSGCNTNTNPNPYKFQQYEYQDVGFDELYLLIYSLWRSL